MSEKEINLLAVASKKGISFSEAWSLFSSQLLPGNTKRFQHAVRRSDIISIDIFVQDMNSKISSVSFSDGLVIDVDPKTQCIEDPTFKHLDPQWTHHFVKVSEGIASIVNGYPFSAKSEAIFDILSGHNILQENDLYGATGFITLNPQTLEVSTSLELAH